MQRQTKVRERELAREKRELERRRAANKREAERLVAAEARVRQQWERASAADRKRLEKELREAHLASRQAEVERLNADLESQADEIESLLAATLAVDDYVDLELFRGTASHPPFEHTHLQVPTLPPHAPPKPEEPILVEPPPPSGWWDRAFGKSKHAAEVANAQRQHAEARVVWRSQIESWERALEAAAAEHARAERERMDRLRAARERYAAECEAREAEQAKQNKALDTFIANLGYGDAAAVQEYVSIVLSNSIYPAHFPVEFHFKFDPRTAEINLAAIVPAPDALSTTKSYKYNKASDEVTETKLSVKACKDRYASAVHQVAIRTFHEIFEADRRGLIKTISLEVRTQTINPATGLATALLFVAVGAERESFMEFDLSAVVPLATLAHLGASVSKNPYELVPAIANGVRRA